VGVFVLFTALGVLYTYPLVHHLRHGLPYTHSPAIGAEVVDRAQGDYLQFYYHLWLFRDTVLGNTPFLSNPYEFAWDGPRPRLWTYFLPFSLVYALLTPLGSFVAYNGLVLLSYGFCALAMYLLAREIVGEDAPAVVAAAVFALAPYRHAVLTGGHPAGSAFALLPLVLLGAERGLRTESRAWSLVAGGAVLGLAFVEPHYLYFVLLILPPLIGIRVLPTARQWWRSGGGTRPLGAALRALRPLWPLALGATAALGVMLYLKTTTLDVSVARAGRSLREIGLFSPEPGDWLVRFSPSAARAIYPGAVAIALAVVGVVSLARRPEASSRRWLGSLAAVFVLAEILTLGPRAPVPVYHWLDRVVPYLGFVRQTSKFQVLAFLALALLAAAGASRLSAIAARWRWGASFLAGILVLATAIDYWPARPVGVSLLPTDGGVYSALRHPPRDGTVLYVPVWPGDSSWSSLYQFATTLTRRPMVNGYSPMASRRYVEEVYWPLDHMNRGEVTDREYARLLGLGVRFVVLDRGAFPSKVSPFPSGFTLARLRSSPYLDLVTRDGPLWLFALRQTPGPTPASLPTSAQGFFFEAERLPRGSSRVVLDPDASWNQAVRTRDRPDPTGPFLLWGAKSGLPRGRFDVLFRIRGGGTPDGPIARIEAVADGGRRTLASRVLTGRDLSTEYADYALPLTLEHPEWVEFRVFWAGRGEVEVDYIYGRFADQSDPLRLLETDDLAFDSGPFRRLPPGVYLLRFRTHLERPVNGPVANLRVVTAHERATLASRLVHGAELKRPGEPVDVELSLRLEAARVVELLVDFLAAGVSVDQVVVTSLGAPRAQRMGAGDEPDRRDT
jgi:hypothetical protein